MNGRVLTFLVAIAALTVGTALTLGQHAAHRGLTAAPATYSATNASAITAAGLPSEEMAKTVLSNALAHRHPQYLDIPAGDTTVRSFVVFPERADNSPVLVITSNNQGMSDWMRAVGDDAAAQGFIAVVPDLLSGLGPDGGGTQSFADSTSVARTLDTLKTEISNRAAAVTNYAIAMPASNGHGASVRFTFEGGTGRIDVTMQSPTPRTTSFNLDDHAWHRALAFLGQLDTPTAAQQAGLGQAGRGAAPAEPAGGMRAKRPDLPANFLMAAKTVAQSPRKGEWVDIPMAGGTKLHTWISYPQTAGKAPVVLVYQPGPGMDMGEPDHSRGWGQLASRHRRPAGVRGLHRGPARPDLRARTKRGQLRFLPVPRRIGRGAQPYSPLGGPRPHPRRSRLRAQAPDVEWTAGRDRLLYGRRTCVGVGCRDRWRQRGNRLLWHAAAGTGDVAHQGARHRILRRQRPRTRAANRAGHRGHEAARKGVRGARLPGGDPRLPLPPGSRDETWQPPRTRGRKRWLSSRSI